MKCKIEIKCGFIQKVCDLISAHQWCSCLWRISLISFNLGIACNGVIVIILGIWLLSCLVDTGAILNCGSGSSIPLALIILGVCMIVTVAIFNVTSNKPACVYWYSFTLFVYCAMQVIMGLYLIGEFSDINLNIRKDLEDHMSQLTEKDRVFLDLMQIQFECCGVNSANDWVMSSLKQVPPSCCREVLCDPSVTSEIFPNGCYYEITKFLDKRLTTISMIIVLLAFFPLVCGLTLFCKTFSREKTYKPIESTHNSPKKEKKKKSNKSQGQCASSCTNESYVSK